MAAMPQGPRGGRLSAIPGNEPAFSGKIRMTPGDEASFDTGRVRNIDDDDDADAPQRGSRAGMWIALLALLVIGGAAGAVYMFVLKQDKSKRRQGAGRCSRRAWARPVRRAPPVAHRRRAIDAAAAPPPQADPLDPARAELARRCRGAHEGRRRCARRQG